MKWFRNKFNSVMVLILFVLGPRAVTAAETAPTPPFIAPIPVPSAWTVTTHSKNSSGQTAKGSSSQFFYTGDVREQILVESDGQRREDWLAKELFFIRQNGDLLVFDAHSDTVASQLTSLVFAEFTWLSAENFVGRQKVAGHDCYIYRDGDKTAAIDVETKLPIQLTVGDVVKSFVFEEPKESLTLPVDVQEKLSLRKREVRKFTANRPPR